MNINATKIDLNRADIVGLKELHEIVGIYVSNE
jgi:hypothetical protein